LSEEIAQDSRTDEPWGRLECPDHEWRGSWNAECTPTLSPLWGPARRRPTSIFQSMSKLLSLRLLHSRSRCPPWPLMRAAATGAGESRASSWKIRPYTLTGRSAFAVHRKRTWLRGRGSRTWCERRPRQALRARCPAIMTQLQRGSVHRRAVADVRGFRTRVRHICPALPLPLSAINPSRSLSRSLALSLALFLWWSLFLAVNDVLHPSAGHHSIIDPAAARRPSFPEVRLCVCVCVCVCNNSTNNDDDDNNHETETGAWFCFWGGRHCKMYIGGWAACLHSFGMFSSPPSAS